MKVNLINDGPVTYLLEKEKKVNTNFFPGPIL